MRGEKRKGEKEREREREGRQRGKEAREREHGRKGWPGRRRSEVRNQSIEGLFNTYLKKDGERDQGIVRRKAKQACVVDPSSPSACQTPGRARVLPSAAATATSDWSPPHPFPCPLFAEKKGARWDETFSLPSLARPSIPFPIFPFVASDLLTPSLTKRGWRRC